MEHRRLAQESPEGMAIADQVTALVKSLNKSGRVSFSEEEWAVFDALQEQFGSSSWLST